jgi:hypothetical protein
MERCPNCGAPARPNANFCTTCGVRLPDDLSPAQPPVTESAPPAPAPLSPSNGWPLADERANAEPASEPTGDGAESEIAQPETEPAIVIAAESETIGSTDTSADAGATAWPTSAAWPTWSAPTGSTGAFETTDETATLNAQDETVIDEAAVAEIAEPSRVERALILLDELRALLPVTIADSTPTAPNPDLADALSAALAADDDDVAALRAAMERARERPKDIDTVLDLAGRVDAVIALLDAHDRLRAAAESTVAQLRGG